MSLAAGGAGAQGWSGPRPQLRPELPADPAPEATAEATAEAVAAAVAAAMTPAPVPPPVLPESPSLGPETNLPLPRFVSLKTDEGNVRRGPSLSHRIDWVFVREDMPLQVTAEYGNWRRVVDREGFGGWVHYSLLSGTRTVLVVDDLTPIRSRPEPGAPEVAELEAGVIARLGQCNPDWCRLSAGGYRGWALKSALWGVAADEIRE